MAGHAADDDLPLALRRPRRSSTRLRRAEPPAPTPTPTPTPPKPIRPRRGRRSDPLPQQAATGLTPMIRRASLANARRRSVPSSPMPAARRTPYYSSSPSASLLPLSGEVRFLPLRQVLDGRVQRRLRRNGLSEEMSRLAVERRRRAREAAAELDRLRGEVRARDDEISELRNNATVIIDSDRVWPPFESPVAGLRHRLGRPPPTNHMFLDHADQDDNRADYGELPTEPNTDVEDDELEEDDATMADHDPVIGETPTRSRVMVGSFLTPPPTSPITPPSKARHQPAVRMASAACQTSFADPEKLALQAELTSLRRELSRLTGTLESYAALTDRLSLRAAAALPKDPGSDLDPGLDSDSDPGSVSDANSGANSDANSDSAAARDIESQLGALILALSDRTTAAAHLCASIAALGFPGANAAEMITALAAGFRTARLELEYLTPGEIALPLTSRGAEVLDLLLARLRDLARRSREDEAAADEHRHIERSLREQLSARVDATDALGVQLAKVSAELGDAEATVSLLRGQNGELKARLRRGRAAIADLEAVLARGREALMVSGDEEEAGDDDKAGAESERREEEADSGWGGS